MINYNHLSNPIPVSEHFNQLVRSHQRRPPLSDSWEGTLPMSPRAPQSNPNLLSTQKHKNSDCVRVCL